MYLTKTVLQSVHQLLMSPTMWTSTALPQRLLSSHGFFNLLCRWDINIEVSTSTPSDDFLEPVDLVLRLVSRGWRRRHVAC